VTPFGTSGAELVGPGSAKARLPEGRVGCV